MTAYRQQALGCAAALASGPLQAAPQTYTIVSKLSRVSFNLEHQGFIQLFGTLRLAPGSFVFDSEDWSKSSVNATIPISGLVTGIPKLDEHLRSIEAALSYTSDNRASAAEILGLSRQSLYSKLHRYGLGNMADSVDV